MMSDERTQGSSSDAPRHSEAIYRTLFNSMDQGFCLIKVLFDDHNAPIDYQFIDVNAAFERQMGIANTRGQRLREIASLHESTWIEISGQVALTGEAMRFEQPPDQQHRIYEGFAFRIGQPAEHIIAIQFTDITEHKRAEAAAHASEERQGLLLRLSDALGPLSDPIAIQETVTQTAIEYFGADRCYYCEIEEGKAIIRRDAFRGALPSVAGVYPLSSFAILQAVIDGGIPFRVRDVHTTTMVDEALREICIQLQVISFIDVPVIKQGKPVGVLCLVQSTPRDWTDLEVQLTVEIAERTWAAVERARAEERVRGSEYQLRLIIDAMPALIAYIDVGLRYRFNNKYYLDWFGRTPEEIHGKHLREFLGDAAFEHLRPTPRLRSRASESLSKRKSPLRKAVLCI